MMHIVARRVLWECVDTTHAGEKEEPPPSTSVVAVFQTDGRGGAGRRGTSLWGPRIPACRAACLGDLRRL